MSNKRILIVDDSCLFQRRLADAINARDGLEVVGVAPNGHIALSMMLEIRPDLVMLDISKPDMDGIRTLSEIRKRWPSVRTIVVSSLTSEDSDITLDALSLGASEYAVKPSSMFDIDNMTNVLANDFIPKIQALCCNEVGPTPVSRTPRRVVDIGAHKAPVAATQTKGQRSKCEGVDIIAIGVSTGGPDALDKLLSAIPVDIGVPIVIVQHMPAEFTTKLARRLDANSSLTVVEAQLGDKLRAGKVYIAPGNYHMTLDRVGPDVIINLNLDEPENSCRPSVDPLFRSIPAIYGSKCLGVIMTGMGADGLNGCEALSAANCPIIVQNKATSIVWGMPKLVAMAGLAQDEVALDAMADVVTAWVQRPSQMSNYVMASPNIQKHTTISGRRA